MNLSKAAKVTRVSNAVAAGTSDVNSSGVEMTGFEACQFLVAFGAIISGAVTNVHVEGSHDGSTGWTDLEGTAVTVADSQSNELVGVDVGHPRYKHLRCVVDRGTQNAVIDSIIAAQYLPREEPVAQPSTTTLEFHHAPAAGVA